MEEQGIDTIRHFRVKGMAPAHDVMIHIRIDEAMAYHYTLRELLKFPLQVRQLGPSLYFNWSFASGTASSTQP